MASGILFFTSCQIGRIRRTVAKEYGTIGGFYRKISFRTGLFLWKLFYEASGITVLAVETVKTYRQRTEELSEEEQEEIFEISTVGETTELSRPFTEEEQEQ